MIKASYQAAICGRDGAYGVVFPDLPGCTSAGETIDHAVEMAHEALELHLSGMIEDGETLPDPINRDLAEVALIFDDPDDPVDETWHRVIEVTVQLQEQEDTVPIRVKADLVRRIAALAQSMSNRIDSGRFIEQAVEHEIERYRKSA